MSSSNRSATWVWHAADGSDLRSMHDFILLSTNEGSTLFECVPRTPGRAVSTLLGACGFTGSPVRGVDVTVTKVETRGFVLLRGFELGPTGAERAGAQGASAEEAAGEIEMEIRSALAGELGGFFPVLATISSFHSPAHLAFEYVWAAAGKPPISVRPPALARGQGRGKAPLSPISAAWGEARYALSCTAGGEQEPSPDTSSNPETER